MNMVDDINELVPSLVVNHLAKAGITKISDLFKINEMDMKSRFGEEKADSILRAAKLVIRLYEIKSKREGLASLKLKQDTEYRLLKAGVFSVLQLKQMDKKELMKIHTLGKKGVKEILEKLKNLEAAAQVKQKLQERKAAKQAK